MKKPVLPVLLAGTLAAADSDLVSGLNGFTVKSYQQVKQTGRNLILSPLNIATVLSMVLSGARGQTADEMRSVWAFQAILATIPRSERFFKVSPKTATPEAMNYLQPMDSGCRKDSI